MPLPYIPVPNTLQANVRFTCAGQQIENTFNFDYESLGFGAGAIAAAGVLSTTWWPPVRGALSNQLVMTEIYIVDLSSESGEVRTVSPPTPSNGSRTAVAAPLNVTLCVSFRTAQRGRSYRGRSYVCGLAIDAIDGQNIASAISGGVLAAYQALVAAAGTASVPMVVVSRQHNGDRRTTGVATPIVSALLHDTVVDSQRRRLPGRGS